MSRLELLLEMLKDDPNDPFLHYGIAIEYEKKEDLHGAVQKLERLKETHPDYLPLYYKLGKLYELMFNNIAAVAVYKQGVVLAKQQEEYKTLGELNEAILNLED